MLARCTSVAMARPATSFERWCRVGETHRGSPHVLVGFTHPARARRGRMRARRATSAGGRGAKTAPGKSEKGATAGIKVIHAERRDMKTRVVQPGTIQAFEVTPVYSRISGYVQKYRYNIGDRVKTGDVLIDMWIPDYVEQHAEKSAAVKMAEVQIRVADSLASGGRGQGGNGQGENRVGPGRRQAGPGQLHTVGVGVQTAGDARHAARARRAGSRRDVPSV